MVWSFCLASSMAIKNNSEFKASLSGLREFLNLGNSLTLRLRRFKLRSYLSLPTPRLNLMLRLIQHYVNSWFKVLSSMDNWFYCLFELIYYFASDFSPYFDLHFLHLQLNKFSWAPAPKQTTLILFPHILYSCQLHCSATAMWDTGAALGIHNVMQHNFSENGCHSRTVQKYMQIYDLHHYHPQSPE